VRDANAKAIADGTCAKHLSELRRSSIARAVEALEAAAKRPGGGQPQSTPGAPAAPPTSDAATADGIHAAHGAHSDPRKDGVIERTATTVGRGSGTDASLTVGAGDSTAIAAAAANLKQEDPSGQPVTVPPEVASPESIVGSSHNSDASADADSTTAGTGDSEAATPNDDDLSGAVHAASSATDGGACDPVADRLLVVPDAATDAHGAANSEAQGADATASATTPQAAASNAAKDDTMVTASTKKNDDTATARERKAQQRKQQEQERKAVEKKKAEQKAKAAKTKAAKAKAEEDVLLAEAEAEAKKAEKEKEASRKSDHDNNERNGQRALNDRAAESSAASRGTSDGAQRVPEFAARLFFAGSNPYALRMDQVLRHFCAATETDGALLEAADGSHVRKVIDAIATNAPLEATAEIAMRAMKCATRPSSVDAWLSPAAYGAFVEMVLLGVLLADRALHAVDGALPNASSLPWCETVAKTLRGLVAAAWTLVGDIVRATAGPRDRCIHYLTVSCAMRFVASTARGLVIASSPGREREALGSVVLLDKWCHHGERTLVVLARMTPAAPVPNLDVAAAISCLACLIDGTNGVARDIHDQPVSEAAGQLMTRCGIHLLQSPTTAKAVAALETVIKTRQAADALLPPTEDEAQAAQSSRPQPAFIAAYFFGGADPFTLDTAAALYLQFCFVDGPEQPSAGWVSNLQGAAPGVRDALAFRTDSSSAWLAASAAAAVVVDKNRGLLRTIRSRETHFPASGLTTAIDAAAAAVLIVDRVLTLAGGDAAQIRSPGPLGIARELCLQAHAFVEALKACAPALWALSESRMRRTTCVLAFVSSVMLVARVPRPSDREIAALQQVRAAGCRAVIELRDRAAAESSESALRVAGMAAQCYKLSLLVGCDEPEDAAALHQQARAAVAALDADGVLPSTTAAADLMQLHLAARGSPLLRG